MVNIQIRKNSDETFSIVEDERVIATAPTAEAAQGWVNEHVHEVVECHMEGGTIVTIDVTLNRESGYLELEAMGAAATIETIRQCIRNDCSFITLGGGVAMFQGTPVAYVYEEVKV